MVPLSSVFRLLSSVFGIVPSRGGQPVVFVGCDTGYAVHHAVPLLYSLDRNSPGRVAHLHVVNPGRGLEDALAALAADLRSTELTVTFETVDLSRLGPEQRATYYASVRFVRAVQLMGACERPVFVLDADSIVRRPLELPDPGSEAGTGCEVGLFVRDGHPMHMRVAAGAVLFTPKGAAFAHAVANGIATALGEALAARRGIGWYLDQFELGFAHEALRPATHVFDRDFLDWEFGEHAVIWTGKGSRKHESAVFRAEHDRYAAMFDIENMRRRFWGGAHARKALILVPQLDLPFKRPSGLVRRGGEIMPLRRHWRTFADNARAALREAGFNARILARPMWELTPKLADAYAADVVLVPHRERHQFDCATPVLFWMQTPLPHLFTVDAQGWGAGASGYPFDHSGGDPESGTFDDLAKRIAANESKFDQPSRRSRKHLVAGGTIPDKPYIFFPCQIPHDETIRYHSDVEVVDVVRALAGWANAAGVPVVFKEHPVNRASMKPLREVAPASEHVRWSEGSIHDLIAHSQAVYTVNSGAGLEAILHGKPVMTFGRAEYDGVAIKGEIEHIGSAWNTVWARAAGAGIGWTTDYRRFIDWFANRHAFDAGALDMARLVGLVDAACGAAKVAA